MAKAGVKRGKWGVFFLDDDHEYEGMAKPWAIRLTLPEAIRQAMLVQWDRPHLTVFAEHAITRERLPVRRWVLAEMS
jgi:hypothetical protein